MAEKKATLVIGLKDFVSKGIGGMSAKLAILRQGFMAVKDTVGAIIAVGMDLLNSYAKQEAAVSRLNIALKNNNQFTPEMSEHLQQVASDIQKITTVGDETTLVLMQLGLSMGINAKNIEKATKQAIGLSKAYGVDLNSSMKMVALAQQGEFTMLNRYIPQLRALKTDTEKAAAAERILNDAFKVAQDETNTTAGRIEQLKNQIGDLKEKIGAQLLPIFDFWANKLKIVINLVDDLGSKEEESGKKAIGIWHERLIQMNKATQEARRALDVAKEKKKSQDEINALEARYNSLLNAQVIFRREHRKAIEEEKAAFDKLQEKKKESVKNTETMLTEEQTKLQEAAEAKINSYIFTQEELNAIKEEQFIKDLERAGLHEEAIRLIQVRETANEKKELEKREKERDIKRKKQQKDFVDTMQFLASASRSGNKTLAAIGKSAAITMATINTFKAASQAQAAAPPPLSYVLMAAAIATGMANVAKIAGVKLAEGGIVMPRVGGTSAIIGEAGRAEAVIPLEDEEAKEKLAETFPEQTIININAGTIIADEYSMTEFAEKIDEKLFELKRNRRSLL